MSSATAATTSCSASRATTVATIGEMTQTEETVLTCLVTPFDNASPSGAFAVTNPTVQTFPTSICAQTSSGTVDLVPIHGRDDARVLTRASASLAANGATDAGTALTKVMKVNIARKKESSSRKRKERGKGRTKKWQKTRKEAKERNLTIQKKKKTRNLTRI